MALDYKTYDEAKNGFLWAERWDVLDGNREALNIAHECVDRHPADKEAIRIQFDDGRREVYKYGYLSLKTSQFANMLANLGVQKGDCVAIVLNSSIEFYISMFGTLKRGAVVVPCLPLFGPEAINYRVAKSGAKTVVISQEKVGEINRELVSNIITVETLLDNIQKEDTVYHTSTRPGDLAVMQFSSGTTGVPKAVYYPHSAVALTAVSAKFALGLRDTDNYFCPSSPAWGHGIWYGTVAPLIYGNAIGSYSGKFKVDLFLEALASFRITNISATPMIYRMVSKTENLKDYNLNIRDMSFTGGAIDPETLQFFGEKFGIYPRSFYGSTEVGVAILDFAFDNWKVKPGSLGLPMLGVKVAVLDENDKPVGPGQIGQMAVWRNNDWVKIGDFILIDEDGYYWHKGRSDDIIKSAGYTIGPDEVEGVLQKHPAVEKVAVVGSPDEQRGEIVKAFIVTNQIPNDDLSRNIQDFIKDHLSKHEYPREIEFVNELPETPDGKIKRKELRDLEYRRKGKKL